MSKKISLSFLTLMQRKILLLFSTSPLLRTCEGGKFFSPSLPLFFSFLSPLFPSPPISLSLNINLSRDLLSSLFIFARSSLSPDHSLSPILSLPITLPLSHSPLFRSFSLSPIVLSSDHSPSLPRSLSSAVSRPCSPALATCALNSLRGGGGTPPLPALSHSLSITLSLSLPQSISPSLSYAHVCACKGKEGEIILLPLYPSPLPRYFRHEERFASPLLPPFFLSFSINSLCLNEV